MSNIYIQEPPTTGKVMMKTTIGDIDLELWTKEAPKACRNFIQLCMEGYYDDTIFHRIIKGFIAQGGDPTGTGEGGESIYGQPFKDEFHTRLRFCRRGLLAMAGAGKDDNGSQFFFTFGPTPELQNKHTIFGKVTGETVYNMLKLEEALVDESDRPLYPPKVIKTEILNNPFSDIVPRVTTASEEIKDSTRSKKSGVKNFNLLSFGEEAEEDEEESVTLNKQLSGKSKSAHDNLTDPKLSTQTAVEPAGPPSKKKKEDRSSDWESDDEVKTTEELETIKKEKDAMKERIKSKLTIKKDPKKVETYKVDDVEDDKDEEEYYLGKDRDLERKRKAEEIRKEIRDLKRDVKNEKKAKEADKKIQQEQEEKKEKKTEVMKKYIETQEKYKEAKLQMPKKGKSREDFTMALLNKFKSKLQNAKEVVKEKSPGSPKAEDGNEEDFDPADESWMVHTLQCEEKVPILAKDASTKDDDWFEIYDPRNPLNKRRRGEKSSDSRDDRNRRNDSRRK